MSTDNLKRSWVPTADGHPDFPLENLPLGIFNEPGGSPRGSVAIGNYLLDLTATLEAGVFEGLALEAAQAASENTLNSFFALGSPVRQAFRSALLDVLSEGSRFKDVLVDAIHLQANCQMSLPARVGNYTDFYVGIHHATNVGKLFRPDNPLLPNYKYVPIGYHGRASTLNISGTDFKRPNGQTLPGNASEPIFGPCQRLDYELEIGIWVGRGNIQGEAISISEAHEHIAGLCLLNDWSARDVQTWEYQPLGPFLSKSFATTLSPWVVTAEALQPFRCAQASRDEGDPQPLAYLLDQHDQNNGGFDIELEVLLLTAQMRDTGLQPERIALSNTTHMYWTVAQMITHHTVNGCNLNPGDLLGSGTLSGPKNGQYGSMLEITKGGSEPLLLKNLEQRSFLLDGDEVIFRARCKRPGFTSIGFGECRAKVLAAQVI
jgi:fumarylacetoacetase